LIINSGKQATTTQCNGDFCLGKLAFASRIFQELTH